MQHYTGTVSSRDGDRQWWCDVPTWTVAFLSHVLCISWHWCRLWHRQHYDILVLVANNVSHTTILRPSSTVLYRCPLSYLEQIFFLSLKSVTFLLHVLVG